GYSLNDLPQPAKPGGQSKYGDKKRCPNCGSNAVRGMTRKEMISFYGSNILVLSVPRKCRACGHGYEVIPSKRVCVIMMMLAAAETLIGALLSMGGFVWWAMGGEQVWGGEVCGALVFGFALIGHSMVVYGRYRHHLKSKMALAYYNRGLTLSAKADLDGAIAD